MTIKEYILDVLGKFWAKLKSTYVTNCASTSNNLALAASQGKILQDQITTLNANAYLLTGGTQIVASTNLNNITTIGNYCCPADVTAQTLTNCPITNAFRMKVEHANGTGYLRQTIYKYNSEDIYTRFYTSAWQSWVHLPNRAEMNAAINNITRSGTTFTATKTDGTTFTFDQQDNNTTYSAGTGLSLSGTTFSMPNSGVTAGTYGPNANVNGSNGTTMNVPEITVDAQGRVTKVTNRVYTSVNTDTNTTYSAMTAATASAAGKTGLVPAPAAGKQAQFLRGDATWAVPTNTTYSAGTGLALSGTTFSMSILRHQAFTLDNVDLAANNLKEVSFNVAKSGYTPLFADGFSIANATSNGTLSSWCDMHNFSLAGTTLYVSYRNNNTSSAAKIKITAYVTYMKA